MNREILNHIDPPKASFNGFVNIKEAIILAGGLGTRLRDTVPDLPKCMATVAGRPFLFYVINFLRSQGIEKFIFSLGYKYELIEQYLKVQFSTLNYQCSIEEEPLGTGGAIKLAIGKAAAENVVIVNGDTLFKIDIQALGMLHYEKKADATLALKPMINFDRFGTVGLNEDLSISRFEEKIFCAKGNINGGVYILNIARFSELLLPQKFSFEKEYLQTGNFRVYANPFDDYFIDIGIPEDYSRAQLEFAKPKLDIATIDKSWTAFIDRDGVINHEKKESYILSWQEFNFYDGVIEAFQELGKKFGKIIIVTNQRGVGKGQMNEKKLQSIHEHMTKELENAGGRIDKILYCTSTINTHPDRKPNPGLAFMAKSHFTTIDFSKSVMIGNKPSDMLFGKNAGMYSIFLATTNPEVTFPHPDIDLRFDTLADFAKAL